MRRDRFVCRLAFAALDKFDRTATRHTDGEGPQSIHNIDLGSLQDLAPTILVIAFFQLVVLQQPIPNVERVLVGLALVMLGLTFFIQGLQIGLFPIGETMAGALTRKGSLFWLLAFAFLFWLWHNARQTGSYRRRRRSGGDCGGRRICRRKRDGEVRLCLRIADDRRILRRYCHPARSLSDLVGWPIHYLIIGGYFAFVILTSPLEIIGVAYNSGGVTTSTVTVPPGHRARHRPGQHHSRA